MIVKYLTKGVWGYIDNIRQVANKNIDCADLLLKFYEQLRDKDFRAPEEYMNGEKLPDDICASNIVFSTAVADLDIGGNNSHFENLISGQDAIDNYPASVLLLYIEDCKEYDSVVLVTNQKAYLMNDKGQTIERLV